jgi:3-methyladenine DNA glycosylase AlkD
VDALTVEFASLRDPSRAEQMRAYMKDISPFLGIGAGPRRQAQRRAWASVGPAAPEDVAPTMTALWALPEREYTYAACELFGKYAAALPPSVLTDPVEHLLLAAPWWDSVDSLGTPGIATLVHRHPELSTVIDRWSETEDQWLIRAAIQHQRGLRAETDVARVLQLCGDHATDRRFFVAKAVGWALRDLSRIDPAAVSGFVSDHPKLPQVARREAIRGLERAAVSAGPTVPATPRRGGRDG